jgi:hypothetical protein
MHWSLEKIGRPMVIRISKAIITIIGKTIMSAVSAAPRSTERFQMPSA